MPKSMIRNVVNGDKQYRCLMFVCPGCAEDGSTGLHMLPIEAPGQPNWSWNGNLEAPTLAPSILTNKDRPEVRCHSFLRDGVFEFLSDCGHSLAGQKVPMPDLPDWILDDIHD